ncbi:MAG: UTP--glucose-1-phosphate uridylyltransferase, partial [Caldilineaceae bacterium]|nr:UTP--glucose-1-phosphate uridylyltransferase [Caldilineaceae bacterium]
MQTYDMPTRISPEQHGRANQKMNNETIHHVQNNSPSRRQEENLDEGFSAIAAKMYAEGLPAALVKTFRRYYAQLLAGETGTIPSEQALAVHALPKAEGLREYHQAGMAALSQTVMIKLNGGLGTTMGLAGPKSLIPVKEGHSFLDIIVQQVLHMRRQHNIELPLLFMNSFNTEAATAAALTAYPALTQPIPLSFRQHKVPKLRQEDFTAIDWPDDTEKEWCPPGHGNLYLALYTSGLLKELLEQGYEYAFISNVDNLGATLDLDLLGYIAENAIPFLMEVAARTAADRKGGHLAQDTNQRLILREIAQCPPEEIELFQDTKRYSYFNTNNIWLNLQALDKLLQQREGILDL